MAEDSYIYLYCIAGKPPELPLADKAGDELYCIRSAELYAMVARVPAADFSREQLERNSANPAWLKCQVERHEQVIEGVMQDAAVIPSEFGTVFCDERNVQAFLSRYEGELREKLRTLEGCEEWSVKIRCDRNALRRYTAENNPAVIEVDQEIASASSGKAYLLKRKRQQLIETMADESIEAARSLFGKVLEELDVQSKFSPPPASAGPEEQLLPELAVLVKQDKLQEFLACIEMLRNEYRDQGFGFDCSGPRLPYSFGRIAES